MKQTTAAQASTPVLDSDNWASSAAGRTARRTVEAARPWIIESYRVQLAAQALNAIISKGTTKEDDAADWATAYADATMRALGLSE